MTAAVHVLWSLCAQRWDEETTRAATELVPAHLRARMPRYRRWQDVQMGLCGKLLLARALDRHGPGRAALAQMSWSDAGRPALPCAGDFNVTHGGGLVACARIAEGRIGVDVEELRALPLEDLAAALTPRERRAVEQSARRDDELCRIWTFKEAVVKGDGRGVGIDLQSIDSTEPRVTLDGVVWHVQRLALDGAFVCHVATDRPAHCVAEAVPLADLLR
jgi:4'-phosphopantetheinyl transferase